MRTTMNRMVMGGAAMLGMLSAQAQCDWTFDAGYNSVYTATAPATGGSCPEEDWHVGIGTVGYNGAKLGVVAKLTTGFGSSFSCLLDSSDGNYRSALFSHIRGTGTYNDAIYGWNTPMPSSTYARAVVGDLNNGADNGLVVGYAVHGNAYSESEDVQLFGVAGVANGPEDATRVVGVYGRALNGPVGASWGGYFDGNVQIGGNLYNGGTLIFSDAKLKTGRQDITDPMAILARLRPVSYTFNETAHKRLSLSTGLQYGMIAQEVAEVAPELTSKTMLSPELDKEGKEVAPGMDLLAVNYTAMIPLLVAGIQEEHAKVEQQAEAIQQMKEVLKEQQALLGEMRDRLAACCATAPGEGTLKIGTEGTSTVARESLVISPNPFTERTTVTYVVPNGGRVRLEVAIQDGRRIDVLREECSGPGTFSYAWNTQGLAAGTYLVTLLVDDRVVVKKVVKVGA